MGKFSGHYMCERQLCVCVCPRVSPFIALKLSDLVTYAICKKYLNRAQERAAYYPEVANLTVPLALPETGCLG